MIKDPRGGGRGLAQKGGGDNPNIERPNEPLKSVTGNTIKCLQDTDRLTVRGCSGDNIRSFFAVSHDNNG